MALQALYELDQSTHSVDWVVARRVIDVYEGGARTVLPPADVPLALALIHQHAASGLEAVDVDAAARQHAVDAARVSAVLAPLRGLRKQADYGAAVIRGVVGHRERLDQVIRQIAPEWPVDQMAPIDRNVLRIALWEIGLGEVPVRVAINEAVELARRYSGEGARRMVNGALGAFVNAGIRLDLAPANG